MREEGVEEPGLPDGARGSETGQSDLPDGGEASLSLQQEQQLCRHVRPLLLLHSCLKYVIVRLS